MKQLRRVRWVVVGAILTAALLLYVFPTRSVIAQRQRVTVVQEDVEVLREQNAQLEAEAARLRAREEIERRARRQFNMVYPGERVYRVLPAAGPTTSAPPVPGP